MLFLCHGFGKEENRCGAAVGKAGSEPSECMLASTRTANRRGLRILSLDLVERTFARPAGSQQCDASR
jgi:hypothetical protein